MKTRVLRRIGLWLALCVGLAAVPSALAFTPKERAQGYRDDRILAMPKLSALDVSDDVESAQGLRLRRTFERIGRLRVLELTGGESVETAIARLRASGHYEYVEPDRIVRPFVVPNDPSFSEQWSLRNTGQSGGVIGADIRAVTGWDTLSNASNIKVAVIDSGMRHNHQDFAGNLWSNSRGTPGIDATVSSGSSTYYTPTDNSGHGTHVAGIIGAAGNNGLGIAGVAWRVQLMGLKFIPDDEGGSISDEIECIDYAIANGAHVINASFGGENYSPPVFDAMRQARDAGIIIVAAAGNETSNNDSIPVYPAGYLLDNIVTVASTTRANVLADSSNYGSGSVDLAAPGADIVSTYHESDTSYQRLSGTSMAAPHVSGAVALLKARFPSDTYRQTINRLLRSTTKVASLDGKVQTGGRLNLAQALTTTENRPFNDNFAERAFLSGPNIRVRGSNHSATTPSGEPSHAGVSNQRSLWWTWTPTESTEVYFDTSGSGYDTVLAVYTGTSLDTLQQVAVNDNASDLVTSSRVVLNVSANTTYQVAVASRTVATGLTVLKIGSAPANDSFSRARAISGRSVKVTDFTLNGSSEPSEPIVSGGAGHTVWYSWVAPTSGRYHLAAFATQIDTIAAVYTGSSLAGLTRVASNDDASVNNTDALVAFDATAGTTYYLQVDHSSDDGNDGAEFTLTLTDSAWEFPAYDEITSSPAVSSDGTIYVGAGSGDKYDTGVYAINSNGTRKWRRATGGEGIIGASPSVGSDGTVYVGGMDGLLYALDPNNGTVKWTYDSGSPIFAAPAIAANGTIYFRNETDLHALTPAGVHKWSYSLNADTLGGTYCSPVIGLDGTIYVGSNEGALYALTDAGLSATRKWVYSADGDIYTSPAIAADGTLYFGTLTGAFYALAPGATAALTKWSITLPKFNGADTSITSSPALAPDGTIYFAAYDHKLYALDPQTGSTKWTYQLGDEVRASSPVVAADGTVYVGAYDGLVYGVRADGSLARTFPSARRIRSSPVIAGNRLYFGSNDAKLHAFDLGQSAANSPWPMFQRDAQRSGRARSASVAIDTQPQSQVVSSGGTITLSVAASGHGNLGFQWLKDGTAISGATSATLTLSNVQPASAGIYTVQVSGDTTVTSAPAIVGISSTTKIVGSGTEVLSDAKLLNNPNTYDQILLEGGAITVTADPGQITRVSFIDLSDDIAQVEFSGAGALTLMLDTMSGPAAPVNYNQPQVAYRRGHARIVISGANETTHVTVFSVGRITAVNQALFRDEVNYDGVADIGYLAVLSNDGKFGGIRTANAGYLASTGYTGIYAPGVRVVGPVFVGEITAADSAVPALLLGGGDDVRITGGNLEQLNGAAVQVSGFDRLRFVNGTNSHGLLLPAQANRARLERNGVDVTAQVAAPPEP